RAVLREKLKPIHQHHHHPGSRMPALPGGFMSVLASSLARSSTSRTRVRRAVVLAASVALLAVSGASAWAASAKVTGLGQGLGSGGINGTIGAGPVQNY